MRLKVLTDAELTPDQLSVKTEVVNGRRGKLPAPLHAWIHNPELARRALSLGELLRFDTTLDNRVTELIIIVCARFWTSHTEWKAHKAYALAAGVPEDLVADIAARREPQISDPRLRLVYDVATSLLEARKLPEALYDRAIAEFGERGLAEISAVAGYYCLVSLTLNTFELGLPDNAAPELNDPDFP